MIRLLRPAGSAAAALVAAIVIAPNARAQSLTLADALRTADERAYANRVSDAEADARHAQTTAALRGILPTLRFEGGFARTTDPIGVFGTTLRQRTISQANFDPARLNRPDAVDNYLGAVVLEQPLFNADAWTGRRAASFGGDAADAGAEWTRISTRVDVVRAYYGAIMTAEHVATLEAASRAANAHVRQAEAMVRQGLATKSDALLASVRAGEVDAQLADARASAGTAGRQLAVLLGVGASAEPVLPPALPDAASIRAVVAGDTLDTLDSASPAETRADVLAADRGLEAARLDALRARSLYLPRLNAFARWDWNSTTRPYAGDESWTVGVFATWTPFAGASEIAERRAAGGREAAARAMADGARESARLELEQTANALRAALARLDIAERAVAQSTEAHRIVARRYEGGLATVIELLDAAAAETRSALGLSAARHTAISAAAERRRALGLDPGSLAALDAATPVAGTETR